MTVTPNKGYTLPVVGSNPNTWGTLLNNDFSLIDLNLGGVLSVTVAGSNVTLSTTQAQNLIIQLTGTLTANIYLFMPASGGFNVIDNSGTTGSYTVTVQSLAGGTALVVPQGTKALFFCDGLNEASTPLTMPNNYLVANTSGASSSATGVSLTSFLDAVFGTTEGAILYRGVSAWAALAPNAGYYLQSQSTGPIWAAGGGGSGSITQINTGTGLTGGPANSTNTVTTFSLLPIASGYIIGNTGGGTAAPSGVSVSNLLDVAFGSTQGGVLYRAGNPTGWTLLAPGTVGQFLQTQGVGGNPVWASNIGTVYNVALGFGLDGGPITSSGTITRDPAWDWLSPQYLS